MNRTASYPDHATMSCDRAERGSVGGDTSQQAEAPRILPKPTRPSTYTLSTVPCVHAEIDEMGANLGPMSTKTKRTYNLGPETVEHVRELAMRFGAATSQDRVVEMAIERLYREHLDRLEAERWAEAADDPEFRSEMDSIARSYGDHESWPG